MIHARVDVELRDHERAHRAGTAMGTWTWCLLYTRRHELDGYVPRIAVRGAWAGERQALRDMQRLVEVGLVVVAEGGWILTNYASRNETKVEIEARRQAESRRQAAWRARRDNGPGHTPMSRRDNGVTNAPRTPLVTGTEPEPEPEPEPDLFGGRSSSQAAHEPTPPPAGTAADAAKPSGSRRATPRTQIPRTDAGAEALAAWLARWAIPTDHAELPAFLDHHRARGSTMADWRAAWGTWTRNAVRFAARSTGRAALVQPTEAKQLEKLGF